MRPLVCLALAAALAVGLGVPTAAQSLAARQKQAANEERLASPANDIAHRCGAPFSTGFDWQTFSDADYTERRQPHSFCEGAISAIRALCDDAIGNEAVAAKITCLVCAKGPELTGEPGKGQGARWSWQMARDA
ncbi:MAG: hypothetical protein ACFBRM_15025, partial [Pikeienuella sp.]